MRHSTDLDIVFVPLHYLMSGHYLISGRGIVLTFSDHDMEDIFGALVWTIFSSTLFLFLAVYQSQSQMQLQVKKAQWDALSYQPLSLVNSSFILVTFDTIDYSNLIIKQYIISKYQPALWTNLSQPYIHLSTCMLSGIF